MSKIKNQPSFLEYLIKLNENSSHSTTAHNQTLSFNTENEISSSDN